MASIPAKVAQRISAGIKKFQPILEAAKARDVNESDTVVIVTDLLHEVFGYEKYADITSEHMIRSSSAIWPSSSTVDSPCLLR